MEDKKMPEVNIGTLGHVDHGKTTLVQALAGKWADTHSEEQKRGITIRLGYADVTFYKCKKCGIFGANKKCISCFSDCEPVRTVSLIDSPGHETLMATVLSGTALMDGALLLIAANEGIKDQTREHLMAADIAGIKNIVIVQNKIDLVTEEEAMKNYNEIKKFTKGTVAENAPVIPISAQQGINTDVLIETIEKIIPTPKRDSSKEARMQILRSFDINRPGTEIKKLRGGVIGGSVTSGIFKIGDEIEIKPGVRAGDRWMTLKTKITGLHKAGKEIKEAGPGGLLGMATSLDPSAVKSDTLSGSTVGIAGTLPDSVDKIRMKAETMKGHEKSGQIKPNEPLMMTVGTARTAGIVKSSAGETVEVALQIPVCASKGKRVSIFRQVGGRWRLTGWGEVL